MSDTAEIIEIFWENVDWHRQNKNLHWIDLSFGQKTTKLRNRTKDIKLSTVQRIADKLDIDDYTILFEKVN